jgi:hypothetical protein
MADEVEVEELDPRTVLYSCHPIMNYDLGPRFQFTKGVMKLTPEDAEDFDAFHKTLPLREQNEIRKITNEGAEAVIAQFLELQGGPTQSMDSTVNRAGIEALQKLNPKFGTKPVDTPTDG